MYNVSACMCTFIVTFTSIYTATRKFVIVHVYMSMYMCICPHVLLPDLYVEFPYPLHSICTVEHVAFLLYLGHPPSASLEYKITKTMVLPTCFTVVCITMPPTPVYPSPPLYPFPYSYLAPHKN